MFDLDAMAKARAVLLVEKAYWRAKKKDDYRILPCRLVKSGSKPTSPASISERMMNLGGGMALSHVEEM